MVFEYLICFKIPKIRIRLSSFSKEKMGVRMLVIRPEYLHYKHIFYINSFEIQ